MTPENTPLNPEQQAAPLRVAEAREVIAQAEQQHPSTTENFLIVDQHIESLLNAADRGEITGSAGVYSRDQILDQFDAFLQDLDAPSEPGKERPNPYTRIPGKDGLRASVRLLMESQSTARTFEDALKLRLEEREAKHAELLSPENIQEMGEAELTAAEVKEPFAEASRAASQMIEIPDFIRNPSGAKATAEVVDPTPVEPQASVELAPAAQETELEMNERFLRESQAELHELYAQHQKVERGSAEWGSLENQIKLAKEDVGKFAKKVAQLKGGNWT